MKRLQIAAIVITAAVVSRAAPPARSIAIRGGTVIPVSGPQIANGTVLMRDGKIAAVGVNVAIPADAEVVDATGKYVMPGLVDAMTSLGLAASDLNEPSDAFTPQLRAIDAYNPFGEFATGKAGPIRMEEILSGGVTTMYVAPADASVIGGQGAVVKTAGENLDSVIVREPASMDMALGTPPKQAAEEHHREPATRMTEVSILRQMLVKAQEYDRGRAAKPPPPRDLGVEALVKLLKREFPARVQANSPTDIRNALNLSQEFGFDLILDGGASAYDFRETLANRKIPVVLGQVSHPYVSNEEIPDRTDYPPVDEALSNKLRTAGVKFAIASFSRAFGSLAPAGSSKWLLIDASIAGGYGLPDDEILRAVTLSPAEILGVANRVGSIAPGKDADVIVLDGPPTSIKTWIERVYIGGKSVYERRPTGMQQSLR